MLKVAYSMERGNDRMEIIDAEKNQIAVYPPLYKANGDKDTNLAVFPDITIAWGQKLPVFLFDRVAKDYGQGESE